MNEEKAYERASEAIVDWMRDQASGLRAVTTASPSNVVYDLAGQIERMWRSIILPRVARRGRPSLQSHPSADALVRADRFVDRFDDRHPLGFITRSALKRELAALLDEIRREKR